MSAATAPPAHVVATVPGGAAPAAAADLDYRPSYGAAGLAALGVFLLYVLTLAPSTGMWDASEYIAAAYVLGIPHPPGNPFFVLVGRVMSLLPVAPTVAMRINVLAALCSAVAAGVWFLVAERVLVSWLPRRALRLAGGALAALLGATAFTVWNQSVVNEKVYTVSLAFFALVSWLVVRWCDDPEGPKAPRLLLLAAYLIGLGYANHPAGFLVAPAVAAGVLLRRPATLLDWRLLSRAALCFALGLTPFLYQPIRAAQFPALNEGEPTACTTRLTVACTFTKVTADRFLANVNREQYGKPDLADRQAPFTAQLDAWWTYFRWQWLRDAHEEHPGLQTALAYAFLALGLAGGWVHWTRDRHSFWFFGPLVFTVTFALVYYMNFKYTASQLPGLGNDVPREVRDRDYFFIWSFSTWGVWAALGLVALWRTLAVRLGTEPVTFGRGAVEVPRGRSWVGALPVLALAVIPLAGNWRQASRAGQRDTAAFAHDLLNSVEPYGVLVTAGDNDTFPLWYAQEVEGVRRDVLVVCTELLNTDWYARQMVRRPVYPYDAAQGPAIYRNGAWPKPSGPPVKLTLAEVDAIPPAIALQGAQTFQKVVGADTLRITPTLPQLLKGDLLVLYLIRDAWPQRPLYISRSTGTYDRQLGLQSYLLTQGLARKLVSVPPMPGRDTVVVQGDGYLDLARSVALWDRFEGPPALIARGDWVDMPSVSIPNLYTITGLVLADALDGTGRPREAQRLYATAEQIAAATHQTEAFGLGQRVPPRPRPAPAGVGDSPIPGLILPDSDTAPRAAVSRPR
ncbi:hypothetical protein tb265_44210 [Gemmatimonadetes bacterium T265]|nr:hypothetical protein tb265_44210 [Gemmatimonadetes bacterium T265]